MDESHFDGLSWSLIASRAGSTAIIRVLGGRRVTFRLLDPGLRGQPLAALRSLAVIGVAGVASRDLAAPSVLAGACAGFGCPCSDGFDQFVGLGMVTRSSGCGAEGKWATDSAEARITGDVDAEPLGMNGPALRVTVAATPPY